MTDDQAWIDARVCLRAAGRRVQKLVEALTDAHIANNLTCVEDFRKELVAADAELEEAIHAHRRIMNRRKFGDDENTD